MPKGSKCSSPVSLGDFQVGLSSVPSGPPGIAVSLSVDVADPVAAGEGGVGRLSCGAEFVHGW